MNYPACEKKFKATLGEDLLTLGKALARRGCYKQIANAAFCCPLLKNCLIKKTLEALCRECEDLCSKGTNPYCIKVDHMIWRTFLYKNFVKNGK